MATYDVLSAQDPYLTVRVIFAEQAFEQLLVTMKSGAALNTLLQAYADMYESDWLALEVAPTPVE